MAVAAADWQVTDDFSSKQKGDIADARVSELIQLHGIETLSCLTLPPTVVANQFGLLVSRNTV